MDNYIYNEPVQKTEMFYGRHQEVNEILDGFRKGNGTSYTIIGGRRMGKTSMLLEIERQINMLPVGENTYPKLVPIYLDLTSIQPQKPDAFLQAIIVQLFSKIPDIQNLRRVAIDESNGINDVFDGFTTQIKRVIHEKNNIRFAVLVDEIEYLFGYNWSFPLMGKLRNLISVHELKEHLVFAMTYAHEPYQNISRERGSPIANVMDKIILTVFSTEEARKLIDELTNSVLPPKLRDEIVQRTGGHPFLIQYIMAQFNKSPFYEHSAEILHQIIEEFPAIRADFVVWQGSFSKLEHNILTYLIKANRVVPHQELLKRFREADIDPMDIVDAIRRLSYTGIVKRIDGICKVYETNIPMFIEWYQNNFVMEE